ncbi:VOC family protein [Planococcus shenhongbingii]|uniref:VOC family protein n=1 Tax=Planococcus shenhongbingii TaxID=3058398 RepID=A0ABT8N8N0_9BACL|nr:MULTISPECIES: VOC family protein [unclassified Planococcus (in: firmicutes)]MDN7244245.1 VOC family protein [Planococcus sp. N017]WKA57416.1 VOC family protein [Planococcus sp. N016]
MAVKAKEIYVNLPVKDLQKSKDFFSSLGFEFNEEMTNEQGACMMVGENIYVMLLTEAFFKTFTKKELADATRNTEVITAISADSREEVDEMVNKALAAGGTASNDRMDDEYMYGWSFQDVDGHLWEVIYMPQQS